MTKPRRPPFVPFNLPAMVGGELEHILAAVRGGHLAGDGTFTRRCQEWLERTTGAHRVLLTNSCTSALELAALLCEVGPGDEVVMPSFTFVSTANAFVLRGARPVFVEIRPDTLNLDERLVEAAVSERTKAIVPVHYAGVACAMSSLLDIARRHRLWIVEDAAQGVGSTYEGKSLGTLGELGCWSFHETKNLQAGEGGALAIRDPRFVERAEILREKGTDRARFFRGQVDKYTWIDVGSSYLPSELVAAYLYAQFEAAAKITARRRAIWQRYRDAFDDCAAAGHVQLPVVPDGCTSNGHLFFLLLPDRERRDALLAYLAARGINTVFHYVPLHDSPMGHRYGYRAGDLPVTEAASARLLRLPCFYDLDAARQARVIREVRAFLGMGARRMARASVAAKSRRPRREGRGR